jgi:hypothetical protein
MVTHATTNVPIPQAVVTVMWSSNSNADCRMPITSVAFTDSSGVYKGKSRRITLAPGAGCSVQVVSVAKSGHVLVSPQLFGSKILP